MELVIGVGLKNLIAASVVGSDVVTWKMAEMSQVEEIALSHVISTDVNVLLLR